MQSFESPENSFDDPETTENSIYTDDYQTEDAFAQIPASDEFVEEETQEISSVESKEAAGGKPISEAFPAIQKLETFRPKPEKKPKKLKRRKEGKRFVRNVCSGGRKEFKLAFAALSPLLKSLFAIVKKSSREITVVAAGTAILSGCLLILGFASLHA